MIGKLVAVRIEEVGGEQHVTGLVAQAKNRKAVWSFKLGPTERHLLLAYVKEAEAARAAKEAA